jgi:hypothetical protein
MGKHKKTGHVTFLLTRPADVKLGDEPQIIPFCKRL